MEPNDVDGVLLVEPDFPKDPSAENELLKGLPFLDVGLVDAEEFDYFVNRFFAFDRVRQKKGMIEVVQ